MNITVINDCRDENAKGRQLARIQSLFGVHANFIGVQNNLEAAGNCIDVLDALQDKPGLILMNIAPRNGLAKKHENGSPFGYTKIGDTFVVSTIDGLAFSLIKKFQLAENLTEMDIHATAQFFVSKSIVTQQFADYLVQSQFRSFDFLPFAGYALTEFGQLKGKNIAIDHIADAPVAIWWIDNFGNGKTTLTKNDIATTNQVDTIFGSLPYVEHLRNVKDGQLALIEGSSGLLNSKFLEIVIQGGNACEQYGFTSGSILL